MNISAFGKSTPAIIILTAFAFLTVFACGVPATPNLMAPWSSLAFLIVGCALWSSSSPRVEGLVPLRIGAILVFAIGAIVSGEHLLNTGSTGFDRLLFPNLLPRTVPLPGRRRARMAGQGAGLAHRARSLREGDCRARGGNADERPKWGR